MNDTYDFGVILKELRKERGMTQEQLAVKIDRESSVISRYEKNLQAPTFETVRALASIFNVSMDYLSGMEKPASISLYGLSSEQIQLIKDLAEIFRKNNSTFTKKLTPEQYQLIGRIMAQLTL
ncbi:MAG: helix-turn-helix transcriptional regulator [Lachnospiraceae bacterium]|nr:helix-turn-helix transcriptional regulator [Lachnospiraceae bacterium]